MTKIAISLVLALFGAQARATTEPFAGLRIACPNLFDPNNERAKILETLEVPGKALRHGNVMTSDAQVIATREFTTATSIYDLSRETSRDFPYASAVALSPDETQMVVAKLDGSLEIIDVATLSTVKELKLSRWQGLKNFGQQVTSMGFDPRGHIVILGTSKGKLIAWDLYREKVAWDRAAPKNKMLGKAKPAVKNIIFNKTGSKLAIVYAPFIEQSLSRGIELQGFSKRQFFHNTVEMYDFDTGQWTDFGERTERTQFLEDNMYWIPSELHGATFSHDSQWLITWEAARRYTTDLRSHYLHKYRIDLTTPPSIKFWNTETGKPTGGMLQGHKDGILDFAMHGTLPLAASASLDGTVVIWDLAGMKQLHTIKYSEYDPNNPDYKKRPYPVLAKFLRNGHLLVLTKEGRAAVYDMSTLASEMEARLQPRPTRDSLRLVVP